MTAKIIAHPSFISQQVALKKEYTAEEKKLLACSTRELKQRISFMELYLGFPFGHPYAVPSAERPGVAKLLATYQFELSRRDMVDEQKRQHFHEQKRIPRSRFLGKNKVKQPQIQENHYYYGA